MEYHYFTIEDIEMLTFNGIPHLHNHLNYLIHTDKDQKFTNEDSVRNVSFIFDNEGNSKALRWTDDLEKTVLQQLQEIFPMEVNREEADAGEKIRLRNDEQKVEIDFILDGHLEQGYGYKNFKAYNRDVYETSYISEYGYEEYKKQIQEAINHYNKNEFTLEELADSVKEAEKDNGIY